MCVHKSDIDNQNGGLVQKACPSCCSFCLSRRREGFCPRTHCGWRSVVLLSPIAPALMVGALVLSYRACIVDESNFCCPFVCCPIVLSDLQSFLSKCTRDTRGASLLWSHAGLHTRSGLMPRFNPTIFVATMEKATALVNHFIHEKVLGEPEPQPRAPAQTPARTPA